MPLVHRETVPVHEGDFNGSPERRRGHFDFDEAPAETSAVVLAFLERV